MWGASFQWQSSLYCTTRISDQITIAKTHPTLYLCPWFQTLFKISDGIVEMQSCVYVGTKPRPDIKRYCSIKVHEYEIWRKQSHPINRDKDIIVVSDFEVVKTAEVRDKTYLKPKKAKITISKNFENLYLAKRYCNNWESTTMDSSTWRWHICI